MTGQSTTAARPRLAALDIFRGLTVAGMIIVNTPGSWSHVWWPLDHAEWHGFTPTDLVFPAFLCAAGVALGLSFPRTIDRAVWAKVIRRTLLLIAIGWAWQMLARPTIADFRVYGVLPRIGLCYGLAATMAILTARRDEAGRAHINVPVLIGISAALLVAYWALMAFVPVPGYGPGQLTPEGNLAGYLDRMLVTTAHMWHGGTDAAGNVVYDPEGLLSTLPSLANVLFGVIAAVAWKRAPDRATARIAVGGLVLAVIGLALTPVIPLNKRIWTTSFALFTSGLSGLIFALCMIITRNAAAVRLLAPFEVFGKNAITGYILSLLIEIVAERTGLGHRAFTALAAAIGEPWVASFVYALIATLLVLAALIPLHRRGIHLRL